MNNTQVLNELQWCFCGSRQSLEQVYHLAQKVAVIEGDYVECGIASGSGIAAMKLAAPLKRIWGYDSFQGIHLAGPNDTEQPGIGEIVHDTTVPSEELLVSSGVTVCSREWVESRLTGWGLIPNDFVLVEGWVQHTLPKIKPDKIALLRLDMDLYDPTMVALEHLWVRLSKGGVLIVDDGNLKGVVRACADYFKRIGYSPKWVTDSENPMYLTK